MARRRSATRRRLRRVDARVSPYLYIAPFFILFAIFGIFPLLYTAWVSLTDRNLLDPTWSFIGLQNYSELMHDSYFWNAVENTLGIWVLSTIPQLLFALVIAHVLNRSLRVRTFFRMSILLPQVTSLVAVALIFTQLFGYRYGLVNYLLNQVGIDERELGGGPHLLLDRALDDDHLALGRLQRVDLPGRDAVDPGRAVRGRRGRRRLAAGGSSST